MDRPRYVKLADELTALVRNGQLKVGDRLPSVRRLVAQKNVSATTATAALRAVEARGYAVARPQSGYFAAGLKLAVREPATSRPPAAARAVGIDNLMIQVIEASRDRNIAPLGAATPSMELFPVRKLQRLAASNVRRDPRLLGEYGLDYAGHEPLRREILRRYADLSCAVAPEELVVTNGCTEALNLALRTVTRPGDTVAIESPIYYCILQVLQDLGLKALEIASHPNDGLSIDALTAALDAPSGKTVKACLLSANFSNPTGSKMSDVVKARLARLCATRRLPLIEDDIYGDLQHDGARPLPIKAFDTSGHVILCSSFSKTLAPGARLGWICGGRFSQDLRLRKFASSGASGALLQATIADFMRSGGYARHLVTLRETYANHVRQMAAAVAQTFPPGTKLTQPSGGFVIWIELPRGVDSLALFERALKQGINFAPGPLFSASGRFRNFLRLNCGQRWTPALEAAVSRLGSMAAAQLSGRDDP